MEYQDYYATLGVERDASQAEIQRAYRKLARTYHPDINKEPSAEARFKEIGEAYEVLKDAEKRKKYDQYGSAWKQAQQTGAPPPGWEGMHFDFGGPGGFEFSGQDFSGQGPSGFSSFFEMLFGGGRPSDGGFRGYSTAPMRGADVAAELEVTLEDIVNGAKKRVSLSGPEGVSSLEIKVPAGVRSGQKMRLRGKGGQGPQGGPTGDLILTLVLRPHPGFEVDGNDLLTELHLTPWTAALGGEVAVRTLDGPVQIKVPAGSSSGRKIRLRGKGLPQADGGRGDLFAKIRIDVPKELTDDERRLFEELRQTSEFEARA